MFQKQTGGAIRTLEDWQSCIAAQHWADGRSAKLLAETWLGAGGFPPAVVAALSGSVFEGATITEAIVERQTRLPGKGKASCTDLLVRLRTSDGAVAVFGVEGKVDEPFGEIVADWRKGDAINRLERLDGLLDALGIARTDPRLGNLHYQLLHRTYATLAEAKAARARRAALVIHSFDASRTGLPHVRFLAKVLGVGPLTPGVPLRVGRFDGVELFVIWVADAGGAPRAVQRSTVPVSPLAPTRSSPRRPPEAPVVSRTLEEVLRPRVSPSEAEALLRQIPHEHCRQGLATHWQVDPDGLVRPQAMLWLYCWAESGQNSEDAARAAESAFDAILPVSFALIRQHVPHEWARERRYSSADVRPDLGAMLAR